MLPASNEGKISPEELTQGFTDAGVREGESVMLHASLESMGTIDGGAAMVIHRLLRVIGKDGTLLMPTFTSISRHSPTHNDFTEPNCWCGGSEDRHVPFIPELQPDKQIGAIAYRLCSWPNSRRSKHPGYSFVAVGRHADEIISEIKLDDPLLPIKKLQKYDPIILTIAVNLTAVTAIHLAENRKPRSKLVDERALTMMRGRTWVNIRGLPCANGFQKLTNQLNPRTAAKIGLAKAEIYSMKGLIDRARSILKRDPTALNCNRASCLSCDDSLSSLA